MFRQFQNFKNPNICGNEISKIELLQTIYLIEEGKWLLSLCEVSLFSSTISNKLTMYWFMQWKASSELFVLSFFGLQPLIPSG